MLINGKLHTDDATVLLCLFLPHSWWITDAFFLLLFSCFLLHALKWWEFNFTACSFPPTVFLHFIVTRNFYMGLFTGRLVEGDLCSISVAANAQIGSLPNDYHCNHSFLLSLCAASQMHRNSQSRPSRMMIHPFQAPCSRTTGAQFLMTATKIVSLKSFEQCVAGRWKQHLIDC